LPDGFFAETTEIMEIKDTSLSVENMPIKMPDYPEFLQSYESLQQHIRAQFDGFNTTQKGQAFAKFVQRLVPQTEHGSVFFEPTLNEKMSADGGVDLFAESKLGGALLYIQSKLFVDRAETIDSVISKFQSYTRPNRSGTVDIFDQNDSSSHFMLVTLSPLSGIIKKYKSAGYSSIEFYRQCEKEGRISFVDGSQILSILHAAYGKVCHLPNDVLLNFEEPYIHLGDVYVGVVSGSELKDLYESHGDALFFENVRDFLGVQRASEKAGRTTPNDEILKTVSQQPDKMLARNNGIVFGAEIIKPGNSPRQLILKNGSVVNGCQTTMCVVKYSENPCYILVKAVQTDDAWDITKSANYQTSVPDIDLELARYLRPQLVKRAATNLGVQVQGINGSAFQIIDQVYNRKVAYNETRLLYIGIFSRSPNNVFAANYTELMQDLIVKLHELPSFEEDIFESLFAVQAASQTALNDAKKVFCNPSYSGLFERIFREDSLSYRCFLSLLALSGCVNINLAERKADISAESERMKIFLGKSKTLLRGSPEKFMQHFKLSVKIWMQEMITDEDDGKVRRDMYIESKRLNFNVMYKKLCIEADLHGNDSQEVLLSVMQKSE
jgi:hypothetical protein